MAMSEKADFADHLIGAGVQTVPAGFAFSGVEADKRRF
jgi:hypothetical protein